MNYFIYFNRNKPYLVKNKIIKKTESTPGTGFLHVNVYTGLGALPVENATVEVFLWDQEEGEEIITSTTTDKSGIATLIELPVLHLHNNNYKEEEHTNYNLAVKAEGYYTVVIINVEIFPNITSQFNVNVTPVPIGIEVNREEIVTIPEHDI